MKITMRKNLLLMVGIVIVAVCYFLPLTTSCKESNGPEEFISTTQYGFETFNYYVSSIFIGLIIAASFIGRGSFTITIILVLMGGIITLFFNWIGQAGWGRPCGHSLTNYSHLLHFSHILIILACFDNLARKGKKVNTTDELIDQNDKLF